MLDRMTLGAIPPKPHTQLREGGELRFEECFTRDGFDGPYTIMYHLRRPHTHALAPAAHGWSPPVAAGTELPLAKRHYRAAMVDRAPGPQLDRRTALLFNDDVIAGVAFPTAPDPAYSANGDGDELIYVHAGGGVLRTMVGDLAFAQGDYVFVPRGLVHRFIPSASAQHWFWVELAGGLHLLSQFRNAAGQLRMDAPYSHRDFKRPVLAGAPGHVIDEGLRDLVVKRENRWHGFAFAEPPLDVVGWDGAVYPWAFPILAFQPRVSSVHLPPTWHGTFGARGALICSFVPRPVDFHPDAIPCPYPHSSVDCDEIIFYCDGNFTSRKGVGPGSISHHPMGVAHGPHPGAYERSIGSTHTDELAVMLDLYRPLRATAAALAVDDPDYQGSFR